jgi:hypothetical protein
LLGLAATRHAYGTWRAKRSGTLDTEQNCDELDAAFAEEVIGG